ncbi:MAG: 30S ribosomal protein S8 [Gammaproteobacteria bacterium RIFOXYB2_FULL_38_6]|nr:MAG: 30S ribosomal protein S8 [Gammaproteobacteria bacterium RIFOXYB2_FULL_38_6]
MTMQDPIADMFIRIKNAQAVFKKDVQMPLSKMKLAIAQVLKDEGFVEDVTETTEGDKPALIMTLKYYMGKGVIERLTRTSRPGLRIYKNKTDLPKVKGGLGVAIVSTSQGVMSDRKARSLGVGGEVIGYVS